MGKTRIIPAILLRVALVLVAAGVGMAVRDWLTHPVKTYRALTVDQALADIPIISSTPSGPIPQPKDRNPIEKPDLGLYGATGTPIISGFVTDLQEYNAQLRGRNAFPTYEQMRRSDADVAAILAACKLPIRAAEPKIVPGVEENEPEYALAKETAEFVEDCLFGGLEYENSEGVKFSQSFESVIENALLCLDFGCSGSEDLWKIDGDRIRLRRIAPRLPMTFYQFVVDEDGESLRTLVQWGYRGSNWVTAAVPANKITLYSYRKEGANFYGISMLRQAYQHWYVKSALYRIDSIACERGAAGVPTIVMGENPSIEDKLAAAQWAENLAANENTSLALPSGWIFENKGITGRTRDIVASIQHHSEMICRSALAMFMALGTTASGSRALGNTMVDFFQLSEEATARFVADLISNTTIRRLVDLNYPRAEGKLIPYPRLVFPNIAVLNPIDIMVGLKDMADAKVDMIQPDDETENWFRKKLGMPLKAKEARVRYAPVVQRMQEDDPGGNPEDVEGGNVSPQPRAGKRVAPPAKQKSKQKAALTELVTRELKAHEQKHDFAGHAKRQDQTQAAVRRLLYAAKPGLFREAARRAAVLEPRHLDTLVLPFDRSLVQRIAKSAAMAHGYGYSQVYAERYRATKRPRTQKPSITLSESAKQDTPLLIAEAAISDFNNSITAKVRGAHVDNYKKGLRDDQLERAILDDLSDSSDGYLDRIAIETSRSSVAGGRFTGFQELAGEIGSYVRSEAMDQNTCGPCEEGDGREWKSLDDVDWSPGDDCEGVDACRGQLMPIFEDEGTVQLG